MNASIPIATADERLLGEALVVVRSARERAPTDFLVALALVLGGLALALAVVGLLLGGPVADLCRNLAVEVAGAWLTVVLVDGLWSRHQTGAAERLRDMEERLEARIASDRGTPAPLDPSERDGWCNFVAEYQDLTNRTTLLDRLRAARDYGARVHRLERQGERLLGLDSEI